MTIGEKIKAARLAAGLTQAQLAEKLGMHYPNISSWERGERTPKISTLRKIAVAIGLKPWELLLDEAEPVLIAEAHLVKLVDEYMEFASDNETPFATADAALHIAEELLVAAEYIRATYPEFFKEEGENK